MMLNCSSHMIINEDLILPEQQTKDIQEEEDTEEVNQKKFAAKKLAHAYKHIEKGMILKNKHLWNNLQS